MLWLPGCSYRRTWKNCCPTSAWCLRQNQASFSRCLAAPEEKKRFLLTSSRNLLPPVVLPFTSSSPACSHWVPLQAACDGITLWKWNEGEDWIRLERGGWIKGRDVCLYCPSSLTCSFLSLLLLTLDLILENLISIHFLLSFSPFPSLSSLFSAVRAEWLLRRWACKGQSNYCLNSTAL